MVPLTLSTSGPKYKVTVLPVDFDTRWARLIVGIGGGRGGARANAATARGRSRCRRGSAGATGVSGTGDTGELVLRSPGVGATTPRRHVAIGIIGEGGGPRGRHRMRVCRVAIAIGAHQRVGGYVAERVVAEARGL